MTRAHNDKIIQNGTNKGYSIRVGKKLPKDSANLAYVSTPQMGPTKNLLINDLSNKIKENGLPSVYEKEKLMFPDDTFLLHELAGNSQLPSNNIVLTDEFSIPSTSQDTPIALYYRAKLKGYFDAKGALVVPYVGGYQEKPAENPRDYAQLSVNERESMLYLGNKIQVSYLDGSDLKKEHKYKIHLVEESGVGLPVNTYSIYVYTNFCGSKDETFAVRYERYNTDSTHTKDYLEILNAYPFFAQTNKATLDELANAPKDSNSTWKTELNDQVYTVVEADEDKYQIYAPSQVVVANNSTRPAQQFKYKIKADLNARFGTSNPGSVNIGIVYLNEGTFNVENLTGTLWKLYEDSARPAYLDFQNPHPPSIDSIKTSSQYWTIDLNMSNEYYDDYDVIILTGYGFFDMSPYNDALRQYLSNGGKLWIDNAGSELDVLTFTKSDGTETFLTNVGFFQDQVETGFKADAGSTSNLLERLYLLSDSIKDIGYNGVNPKIKFGSGENKNYWDAIVKYSTNNPSIIKKSIYTHGTLLVSNCGVFRSLFHTEDTDMKFAINIILSFAEQRLIHTPWTQDYVYHRDNLFIQEYKDVNGNDVYVDDRNDIDPTQIVAKKVLNNATNAAVRPYLPKEFYSATGLYTIDIDSNTDVPIFNSSFEMGGGLGITTANSIVGFPGWQTNYVAGTQPTFSYLTSITQRGTKAISVNAPSDGTGSHAYWYHVEQQVQAGTYQASVWIKTSNVAAVTGRGATIGIYRPSDGALIAAGNGIIGNQDWVQVTLNFMLNTVQDIEIRLGFVDGNSQGTAYIDTMSLTSIGSIYMTPSTTDNPNNGSKKLYAYAVKPQSESINLKSDGFTSADITTYDPIITVTYTIRSYVFTWDNYLGRYVREYGKYVTYSKDIRRSDGIVSLGSVSTLIPELDGGAKWADSNKIYYEVFLGGEDGADRDSQFVNLEIYDTTSGKYFYSKEGENLIRNVDLFNNGEQKQIILQARTNYYTVRATKRRYGVLVQDESRINLEYPSTIDDRDSWFLRVHNGGFVKSELTYADLKELQAYDSRYYIYQQRIFGTHYYSLPEYERQVFKPKRGYKRQLQEVAEYVNDNTIRVQNYPLYILQGSVRGEELQAIDTDRRIFKAENNGWLDSTLPVVYIDQANNGNYIVTTDGFDIDYANGCVVFTSTFNGNVKADYSFNNLDVIKRTYSNSKIVRERMLTTDKKTFTSKHGNWLAYPTPVIKVVPYNNESEEIIVPTTAFTIDYLNGVVIFKEDINSQVYVDYCYSNDTSLLVRDYDTQNGLIYLENPIDFKDEIYVDYYYEEDYVEYRGYYNDSIQRFVHLDLNPSEGHFCTMPVVRNGQTTYEQVPTAKLMNKEVYVYVVPYQDSFDNRNQHTIRHCYSLYEWQQIQKTMPTALLLGVIHLREHAKITDAVVLDTRTRGGGLKEDISDKQIQKTQPLAFNNWDLGTWDGKAYYKNGTVVINLPKAILQSEGGQFTEKQVKDIVGKYIAYGIYYIIEYV